MIDSDDPAVSDNERAVKDEELNSKSKEKRKDTKKKIKHTNSALEDETRPMGDEIAPWSPLKADKNKKSDDELRNRRVSSKSKDLTKQMGKSKRRHSDDNIQIPSESTAKSQKRPAEVLPEVNLRDDIESTPKSPRKERKKPLESPRSTPKTPSKKQIGTHNINTPDGTTPRNSPKYPSSKKTKEKETKKKDTAVCESPRKESRRSRSRPREKRGDSSDDDLLMKHEKRSSSRIRERLTGLLTLGSIVNSPNPRGLSPSRTRRARSPSPRRTRNGRSPSPSRRSSRSNNALQRSQSCVNLSSSYDKHSQQSARSNTRQKAKRRDSEHVIPHEASGTSSNPTEGASKRENTKHHQNDLSSEKTEAKGTLKTKKPKDSHQKKDKGTRKAHTSASSDSDQLDVKSTSSIFGPEQTLEPNFPHGPSEKSKKSRKKHSSKSDTQTGAQSDDGESAVISAARHQAKLNRKEKSVDPGFDSSDDEGGEVKRRRGFFRNRRRSKSVDSGFDSSDDEGGVESLRTKLRNRRRDRGKTVGTVDDSALLQQSPKSPRKSSKTFVKSEVESSDDEEDEIAIRMKMWKMQKKRQQKLASSDDEGEGEKMKRSKKIGVEPSTRPGDPLNTSNDKGADDNHDCKNDDDDDDDKTIGRGNKSKTSSRFQSDDPPISSIEEGSEIEIIMKIKKQKNVQCENVKEQDNILKLALDPAGPKSIKVKKDAKSKTWKKYKAWTLDCLGDYIIRETKRSEFGGRLDFRDEATGYFSVKQINGRWTFLDPEGFLFTSVGINGVCPLGETSPYKEAFATEFESNSLWASNTNDHMFNRLRFNTLGSGSDPKTFSTNGARIPYCPRWDLMLSYCKKRHYGKVKPSDGTIPCFDPEFEKFCDEQARQLLEIRDDPYVLGHLSDGELPVKETGIISRYLGLPKTDPGHQAAQKWMSERSKDVQTITDQDDTTFCTSVISQYFRIVSTAIKKYDPNHLFLGSCFHEYWMKQDCSFLACAPWVDVVSINYYHSWTPEQDRMNHWTELSGRPLLITECSAKADDTGCSNSVGVGFVVPTQKSRAAFYENYTINLLRNPNVIGWHWAQYIDDDDCNRGVLDARFQPHATFANAIQRVNSKIYSLSDYLLSSSAPNFTDDDNDDD